MLHKYGGSESSFFAKRDSKGEIGVSIRVLLRVIPSKQQGRSDSVLAQPALFLGRNRLEDDVLMAVAAKNTA
eukprot:357083-Pyramimonas_sp.AAC.1